jgi:hypothetical protein
MDEVAFAAPKDIIRNSLTTTVARSPDCFARCTMPTRPEDDTITSMNTVYKTHGLSISLMINLLEKENGASPNILDTWYRGRMDDTKFSPRSTLSIAINNSYYTAKTK